MTRTSRTALIGAAALASLLSAPVLGAPKGGEPLVITPAATDKPALNERAIIERANAALNATTTLSADFTQVSGDGRRLTGLVYVQRPGKLRFEYAKPSTLEVVSDGSTVLVRDRKLNTSDPYPISQTPLKFLLSSRIDLSRDATVRSVGGAGDGVQVTIEDSSTLGGTSRITLTFDKDVTDLKRWRVTDPQGYTTTVSLSDVEKNRSIDPKIFMLNYMRPVD
jgi:outer membrane lipoprotein-sorting protein